MALYLGIDAGGTATKAAIFDKDGDVVAEAHSRCGASSPGPGKVERDMEEVWSSAVAAVRGCLDQVDPREIAALSVVGHSDGLYPVDSDGTPVAEAVHATDTRASAIVDEIRVSQAGARIAEITGTKPFAGSPAAVCLWLKQHNPNVLDSARWLLFAKDWIRYCLTGEIATDPSDGSASFLDIRTGEYSDEALDLYGLSELKGKLPPVLGSTTVAGEVTQDAARLTGLVAGTPVVIGAHDVDAASIGLGAVGTGDASVVAGTFSINQVVVDSIHIDDRWQVRSFVEPDRWLAMSTSPTSASNLGWFVETLGGEEGVPFSVLEEEVEQIDDDPSEISFLPYIYGAPDSAARASFVGIGGHHRRGHLTRSILQGVVMSHRLHLEWLENAFTMPDEILLTGGPSKSAVWVQTFADGLGRRVRPGDSFETARGAAALASVGVGGNKTIEDAARAMAQLRPPVQPRPDRASEFDHIYERFLSHREMAREIL